MFHALRLARIREAGGHTLQQTDLAVYCAQQQRPTVGGHPRTVEPGHYLSREMCFKRESCLVTLCHGKGRLSFGIDYASTTQLCLRKRPFSTSDLFQLLTSGEKSGLKGLVGLAGRWLRA